VSSSSPLVQINGPGSQQAASRTVLTVSDRSPGEILVIGLTISLPTEPAHSGVPKYLAMNFKTSMCVACVAMTSIRIAAAANHNANRYYESRNNPQDHRFHTRPVCPCLVLNKPRIALIFSLLVMICNKPLNVQCQFQSGSGIERYEIGIETSSTSLLTLTIGEEMNADIYWITTNHLFK